MTQTDAAHLSRFEWSERDRRVGIVAREDARGAQKKREEERSGGKRKRDGTKGGRGESRETKEDGRRVFGRRGLPVAPGPPAGGGQFAAPFFLIPLLSLSRPSSRSPSASLFLSLRQTPRALSFLRPSSFHRFFISRPDLSLSFPPSLSPAGFSFLALRSHGFSFRAVNVFFPPPSLFLFPSPPSKPRDA